MNDLDLPNRGNKEGAFPLDGGVSVRALELSLVSVVSLSDEKSKTAVCYIKCDGIDTE
jgi:hypothetical protein